MTKKKLYLTLLILLINIFVVSGHLSGAWLIETIDDTGDAGRHNSIGADQSGYVHVSYVDWTNHHLKYGTNASGSWITETIDTDDKRGRFNSLTIDSGDQLHVSYYDWTNGNLRYAEKAIEGEFAGNWVTTATDSTGDVGEHSSIAVDLLDHSHISYIDVTNGDLKYATNSSGAWVATSVDATGSVGHYSSIATDISNNIHIGYYDSTNGDLKYATNATGTWVAEAVDTVGNVGHYTSIAVDMSGSVHISYLDWTNGSLKHATNSTGAWVSVTVDNSGVVGYYSSIAVDASGKIHISYIDVTNGDVKYATNASGAWISETVDSDGDIDFYTSIDIASSDTDIVHISYYNYTEGSLKYATGNSLTDIKANSSDAITPLSIHSTADLSVTLSLNDDLIDDSETDWWIYAVTPAGTYYYDTIGGPSHWQAGLSVTHQGELIELNSAELISTSNLSPGTYKVYFEIDTTMDGERNTPLYSDMVTVEVQQAYILTVTNTGDGSGSVTSDDSVIDCGADCEASYVEAASVILTATADADSEFTGWSGGGCTGITPCTIKIEETTDVTALFELLKSKLTVVTTGTGAGTVTSSDEGINCGTECEQEYPTGTTVELAATPDAGSLLIGWSEATCTGTTCEVELAADTIVTATFDIDPDAETDDETDDTDDDEDEDDTDDTDEDDETDNDDTDNPDDTDA